MQDYIIYDGIRFHLTRDLKYRNRTNGLLHRYIWTKFMGPIPKNHVIHHLDLKPLNNDLYNLCCMSRSHHTLYHQLVKTDDTRLKRSASFTGENNHFFGKKHSEETKRKMSLAQKKFRALKQQSPL